MSSQTDVEPHSHEQVEAEILARCEQLVELAQAGGADEAEAFATGDHSVTVRYEKGDLKIAQIDEGTSLGLRVFKDGRQGFSSTNQVHQRALETTARDACSLAGFSPPDEHNGLPQARDLGTRTSLVHPALNALTIDQVVDCADDLVSRTLAVDPRLSLDQASVRLSSVSVAIHTSQGVHASESDAQIGTSVFGMAIDGDDVGGFDYHGDQLRDPQGLEQSLATIVKRFTTNALGNLGAAAGESYKGPVLFAPDAFLSVFVQPICSAASALAVQRGRSALAQRLGESICDARLSIFDDPTDRRLAGAAHFDREGQPVSNFALVKGGVLQSFLYHAYAGRVEGRDSTGHAVGGARAVPGLGPHALRIEADSGQTQEQLIQALGKGLLVQRFSGTVDPASGDFSGVAKSARWVEGGRVVRSVKEALIAGNVFETLRTVVDFSAESENLMGSALVPWALIDGISVTAG